MNLIFFTFACLVAIAASTTTTKATTKATTVVTKKDGSTRKARLEKKKFADVHLAKDQSTCLGKNGKWVDLTLTDEGGANGLQLDFVKVHDQKAVKSIKTPISKSSRRDRRLSRRGDVVTFKDSFCLDYLGKDFSPCYDIVTSSQGKSLEELSWSVKIAAMKKASEEEKKKGLKDKVVEAVKEGAAYDDVKILCGRLFKQLGRYTDRQLAKLAENSQLDANDKYRHQKQGDRMLRTAAKIAQKAEDMNLVASS